jgi:predicted transcriptional regulator
MYDQGRKLYLKSSPHLAKADRLYDQGKRPEACEEYKLCKKDFTDALDLVQKWMADQDMNEHYDVETMAREIRIKLKHVNDRLSMLEASPPPDPAAPN